MPDEDTPTSSVSFKKDIPELLDRARQLGLEGLIGKRAASRYEVGKHTGAWIKLKLQQQEFVIGGYTEPEGSRKYFGALLVGFYKGEKLRFAGRVGTGFSDKLLRSLFSELEKIRVEKCPFFNLPATGRSRWDRGLTAADMRRCKWVRPVLVLLFLIPLLPIKRTRCLPAVSPSFACVPTD